MVGGLGIAVLGFLDDHGHIAARWRLLGHFSAAMWVLYCIGGLAPINIFGFNDLNLLWVGHILAVFYIVWVLNLYNFMDGIDGLASVEAICACVGIGVIYALLGYAQELFLPLTLALAVGGFLIWNFPPAKIFMGDSGSLFLGFVISVVATISLKYIHPISVFYLAALPIVDTLIVMVRRIRNGKSPFSPDKTHIHHILLNFFQKKVKKTIFFLILMQSVFSLFGLMLAMNSKDLGTGSGYATMSLILFITISMLFYMIFTGMKRRQNLIEKLALRRSRNKIKRE